MEIQENLDWIKKGNTGCTFATLFAKNPEMIGWKTCYPIEWLVNKDNIKDEALLIGIMFPYCSWQMVRDWAINQGFFVEETSENTEGLRIQCKEGVAWVQYFGPDSHVITRQAPHPMLLYTNKLNKSHYVKVGFKGILHLAHAWYDKITDKIYDLLWDRSYKQTCKKLGHKPTINEAAKTTFLK